MTLFTKNLNFKSYKVKKGNHHFNGFQFYPFFKKTLQSKVIFKKNCLYKLKGNDHWDLNKLLGFSLGFHHHNSARIGWRTRGSKIELMSYVYDQKEYQYPPKHICYVYPEEEFYIKIKKDKSTWYFEVINHKNKKYWVNITAKGDCFWGYLLFPYFGGNKPAPHDMEIFIKII